MANTPKMINLTDALYSYVLSASLRETEVQRRLRAETAKQKLAIMQVAPEQAQFMALLAELIGARRCIELGVFTGYSTLAVAQALPSDGLIVACDPDPETTAIARRYWEEAGVADRIDLRLAPGAETLDALIADGGADTFDFAFVDADKLGYPGYYEQLLVLVRPGGLLLFDNVLWGGSVADPEDTRETTEMFRAFNDALRRDARVSLSLLPIADGLSVVMKRRRN